MLDNPAERKNTGVQTKKSDTVLSFEDFKKIRNAAEPWLRTAIELVLQTTQARLEVSRIRYNIKSPQEGICGCIWYKEPQNNIYGMLYIYIYTSPKSSR